MTLRTQLIIAFGVVAMIPLVGGAIGIYSQRQANRQAHGLLADAEASRRIVDTARRVQVGFQLQAEEWKNILLRGHDQAAFDRHVAGFDGAKRDCETALRDLAADAAVFGLDPQRVDALRKNLAAVEEQYAAALARFVVNDPATSARADAMVAGVNAGVSAQIDQLMTDIYQRTDAQIAARRTHLERESALLERLMLVGTIAGIAIGGFFGWITSSMVVGHLRALATRMQDRTGAVAAAAQQVSASSATVAASSSDQASAIEASSAAISQVNTRVKQNAERAREARRVSEASRAEAEQSSNEISELQTAMHESVSAAGNITKIIKSIDEIAFQTNLLALNAAVEAARAGESGAGFAVVADEVRNLAQRSAHAARETAGRIEDATAKSTRGAELADRVGQTLRRVVENTRSVDTLVRDISEASVEQAGGLEQVVASMQQIDRLTQSNTAAAEDTAQAAHQLEQEAGMLRCELAGMLARRARLLSATPAPEAQPASSEAMAAEDEAKPGQPVEASV